jgi:hypothetical protein
MYYGATMSKNHSEKRKAKNIHGLTTYDVHKHVFVTGAACRSFEQHKFLKKRLSLI